MQGRTAGRFGRFAASVLAAALAVAPAAAAPADSLVALSQQMEACMAEVRVTQGTDVTVQFMLNRRGGLIGKPRITHAGWAGDDTERKQSAASIAQGFDRCLPIAITDKLGGAIAGRLFTYRFFTAQDRQRKA